MRATRGWSWIGAVVLATWVPALFQAGDRSGTERVLEHFELIPQPDPVSCGPACAAMVLRHYGGDESAAWVELRRLDRRVALMSPRGLRDLLASGGVDASVRRGALTDLTAAIDAGRPAILLVRIGPIMWHYVVAFGYRDAGAAFLLADPYGRSVWVDAATLDRSWSFDGDLEGRPIKPPREDPAGAADPIRQSLEFLGLTPRLLILPERSPDR